MRCEGLIIVVITIIVIIIIAKTGCDLEKKRLVGGVTFVDSKHVLALALEANTESTYKVKILCT